MNNKSEHTVKPPRLAKTFLKLFFANGSQRHRLDEFEEIFQYIAYDSGIKKAKRWYRFHVIKSVPILFYNNIISGGDMLKNYLLIALRTIRKSKFYSAINIVGLALGIACSLLIYMYVVEELSYDNYHEDVNQIYRVYEEISSPTSVKTYASVAFPVPPTLLKDYPQVEYAARLYTHISTRLIKYNDKTFYEPKFIYGEEDIFKILSFKFVQGNPDNALTRQNTIVITKSIANKYFGDINPVGKVLQSNGTNYEVTGVIEDLPYNTHLKFDLMASLKTLGSEHEFENGVNHLFVDPDFFNTYQIEMEAGRSFNKQNPVEESDWGKRTNFIINDATANVLGFANPAEAIGLQIQSGLGAIQGVVIGVTKNFHYAGLQTAVEPLVMSWFPKRFSYLTMNIKTNNVDETIKFTNEKWSELFPGSLMEYKFLDEEFNALYNSEKQTASIANSFTFIGLFIACLGLLGLVSFIVEQRKKEIGIRKVLGSSVPSLLALLIKEFLKWIVISNIIAWPVAYLLLNSWLQDFAYRIDIGIDIFIYAGLISIVLMLFTVLYQSIKAALTNPIDTIKYE